MEIFESPIFQNNIILGGTDPVHHEYCISLFVRPREGCLFESTLPKKKMHLKNSLFYFQSWLCISAHRRDIDSIFIYFCSSHNLLQVLLTKLFCTVSASKVTEQNRWKKWQKWTKNT